MLDKNRTGLKVGFFFAVIHAAWALLIAVFPNQIQCFFNWIFDLHFLEPYWVVTHFNFFKSLVLVVVTFILGYVFGYLFALIRNWVDEKKQRRRTRVKVQHRRIRKRRKR